MTVLLNANFVLLTSVLNNILYINVPSGVTQMAICLDNLQRDCTPTEWLMMNFMQVNDGKLDTFSIPIYQKEYKLKLVYQDGREEEFENWKTVPQSPPLLEIDLTDMQPINITQNEYYTLYIISCITLSLILLIILKICIEIINKNYSSSCLTKINIRKYIGCFNKIHVHNHLFIYIYKITMVR